MKIGKINSNGFYLTKFVRLCLIYPFNDNKKIKTNFQKIKSNTKLFSSTKKDIEITEIIKKSHNQIQVYKCFMKC